MKKYFLLVALVLGAITMSAQTYEVIARSNDTIKLYPNALGAAIKSIVPGSSAAEPDYRMIKKTKNGKESILFVEFINIADKFLVSYETDLVNAGVFRTKIHSLVEVFKAVQRVNAIYLEGEYLGMKIQVYQRPLNFKDVFIIDGITLQLPIKVIEIEEALSIAQEKEEATLLALQQKEEAARLAAQQKDEAALQLEKQKEEARLKKAAALNISPETLKDAESHKCEYYIAYLVKNNKFNAQYVQEIENQYDQPMILQIVKQFNNEQLSFIVKDLEAQKECGKYSL